MNARIALAFSLALGAIACGNPVPDAKIDALGPEIDGVKPGPYHRPGQPCVLCHGPYHGSSPELSVAGTVFAHDTADANARIPVNNVTVTITDSFSDTRTVQTNCAGNFFIKHDDWQPGFPLAVRINCPPPPKQEAQSQSMSTRIGRDGSCGSCHVGGRNASSPGLVACLTPAQNFTYVAPTHDDCPDGVP